MDNFNQPSFSDIYSEVEIPVWEKCRPSRFLAALAEASSPRGKLRLLCKHLFQHRGKEIKMRFFFLLFFSWFKSVVTLQH